MQDADSVGAAQMEMPEPGRVQLTESGHGGLIDDMQDLKRWRVTAMGGFMKFASTIGFVFLATASAMVQTLPAQRSATYNPRSTNGVFDIIMYVDGENFISIQGDQITYDIRSGAPPRNTGSNYNQPIPRARFGSFNMQKIAGRGSVELYQEPNASNDYSAVLRINDPRGGSDLYHVRLEWTWNPADPSSPPGNPGGESLRANIGRAADYDRDRNGEFAFQGRVDGVTAFYIRSDQVRTQVFTGQRSRGERFAFSQPIPTRPLESFQITDIRGRGKIELVEQPWEGNEYTAVVRIQDDSRGAADYAFRLVWRRQN